MIWFGIRHIREDVHTKFNSAFRPLVEFEITTDPIAGAVRML